MFVHGDSHCCIHVDPPTVDAIRVNGSAVRGVVYALNGTMSDFRCVVRGTSPLSTSWELQITSGEISRVGTTFSCILTQDDEGNYTCVVVNIREGLNHSATVTVKVYGEWSYRLFAQKTYLSCLAHRFITRQLSVWKWMHVPCCLDLPLNNSIIPNTVGL